MRKIIICFSLLMIGIYACDSSFYKIFNLAEINISDSAVVNEHIGEDIISTDLIKSLKNKFPDIDTSEYKNINFRFTKEPYNHSLVTIELKLSNGAIEYDDELLMYLVPIVKKKAEQYKIHYKTILQAQSKGQLYLDFVRQGKVDSLWFYSSNNYKKTFSKEDISKNTEQYNLTFKPIGIRKVNNSHYRDSMAVGSKYERGDFYIINYIYENFAYEQVQMEMENDSLKIIGFGCEQD